MSTYYVSSGVTSTGLNLNSDYMYVYPGGTATKTKVDTGGYLIVSNGGMAIETRICESGVCIANGVMDGISIESKGRFDLGDPTSSGGNTSANNTIVYAGGTMNISSGGTATNTTVHSGGSVLINSATVMGLTMGKGAKFTFFVASDSVVQGTYGGSAFEMADASVSDFTIDSECNLFIGDGVKANAITVGEDGDFTVESGGTATSTTVLFRGFLYVNAGGMANSVFMGGEGEAGAA